MSNRIEMRTRLKLFSAIKTALKMPMSADIMEMRLGGIEANVCVTGSRYTSEYTVIAEWWGKSRGQSERPSRQTLVVRAYPESNKISVEMKPKSGSKMHMAVLMAISPMIVNAEAEVMVTTKEKVSIN